MIHIIPTGGLCDRIITIESFYSLSKEIDESSIKVFWLLNDELNCNYEDIFELIDGITVINVVSKPKQKDILSRIFRRFSKLFKETVLNNYCVDLYSLSMPNKYEYVKELIKSNKNFTFSGLLISNKPVDFFSIFNPVKDIVKVVDKFHNQYSAYTVGVHIRRTDNFHAIQNSPSELFYTSIENEILKNKDVKFFVATDSQDELEILINKYNDKIIYQENCERSRVTTNGLKCAMIDLFLLSKTKKIFGSEWSSFSYTASKLGNVPLKRMKNNDYSI